MKLKISDFCHTGSGGTPSRSKIEYYENGSIPWFKSGELNESYLFESEEKITETALKESAANIVPKGSVLIAMYGATVGKTSILGIDATTNQAICHLVPDSKRCNNLYLQYFLRSQMNTLLSKRVGGAQPNINQNIVKNLEIDIPPLPEQIHIANVLSRAEAMITKRKESLALLDAYLKSTFLELFGDPVRNEKGWEVKRLGDVIEIQEGLVNPNEKPFSDMFHVGGANIESGTGHLKNLQYAKNENLISGKYLFSQDHLLYSKIRPYLNKVATPRFVGICSADIYPIKPKEKFISKQFLRFVLTSKNFLLHAENNSDRANIPKINRKALIQYEFCLPPLELQNQFAAVVEKVEALKERYQESLRELEALYGALSQRAFRGELGG